LALALVGCSDPDARVTTLEVRAHELPAGCALTAGVPDPSAYLLALTPLGSFAASLEATSVPLDAAGRELVFDERTRGIDAVATASSGPEFSGHSERRRSSGLDVLLWPKARACALSDGPYPGHAGGQALGYSPASGLAISAGESLDTGSSEESTGPGSTLLFATDLGVSSVVPREGALRIPRAFASVSSFGEGLLVAGGENPLGASTLDAAGTAEVFSAERLGFDATLNLVFRRTRHAAVTLRDSGETLLVGGIEPASDHPESRPNVIEQFEAISPTTRSSSISELAELAIGRVGPTAFVLDDGRIFVGGGSAPGKDAAHPEGDPIGTLEVFSPDGKSRVFYAEPKARPHRAFAPLPGGGVVSVASCADTGAREGCSCFTPEGDACEPSVEGAPYVDGVWMEPDGRLESVAFASDPSVACPTPAEPWLVPGSDGSAWLISTLADGSAACLWRFEPWPGTPTGGDGAEPPGPRFVPTAITLSPPPDPRVAPLSLGPDSFSWIAAGTTNGLAGASLGHRGQLTRDGELIVPAAGDQPRPAHLAPDRNPSPAEDGLRRARATFDATLFRLELEPPESPAPPLTVWVADTTYDAVTVALSIVAPASGAAAPSSLPVFVFGGTVVGDAACPWPAPTSASGASGELALRATRHEGAVTLAVAGANTTSRCAVAAGPLPVGVRAGSANATLVSFLVTRD
jgi:hypothetical protein